MAAAFAGYGQLRKGLDRAESGEERREAGTDGFRKHDPWPLMVSIVTKVYLVLLVVQNIGYTLV